MKNVEHLTKTTRRKSMMDTLVPPPSTMQVEKYLEKWNTLESYVYQEKAMHQLFQSLLPDNTDIESILLKVSVLNDFYGTNIYSVFPVAKHILSLAIDERLKAGDVLLVRDIQRVSIGNVEKSFYSFASKYCSHHNQSAYPIYDSYVDVILRYFRKKDHFSSFCNADLKDYPKFKTILMSFRDYYGLDSYNLKQLDQYLWQLGKEYFPKSYK